MFINSGEQVYVSLAPSFIANYEGVGIEAMRDALMKLGFTDVEETAIPPIASLLMRLPVTA